jgi:NAD(P)-dependent dehydrogenase (short-subunit alcohol dehydrogenase family)
MKNKTVLITGATSGLGKATAFLLAQAGVFLILLGRSEKKGEKLCRQIKQKIRTERVKFYRADFTLLKEVQIAAQKIKNDFGKIDVLINNAGGRFIEHSMSKEGIEQTLAVNYLSHFLLTNLLLDSLRHSGSGRIINISSSTHYSSKGIISNISSQSNYNGSQQYSDSKLAIILFTYKLAEQLKNTNTITFAFDPGGVATNFARNNGYYYWMKHLIYYFMSGQLLSPSRSAQNMIHLASTPNIKTVSGKYFYNKEEKPSSELSYSKVLQDKLWLISWELINKNKMEN